MTCLEVSSVGPLRIHQLFTTQTLDFTASGSVLNETGTEDRQINAINRRQCSESQDST